MKKTTTLLALVIAVTMLFGCSNGEEGAVEAGAAKCFVADVDSCQYVIYSGYHKGGVVHKQNCKYCEERNRRLYRSMEVSTDTVLFSTKYKLQ